LINQFLNQFSKDELISLIELYSKNWLAMDGIWFQSVEQKFGMDEAVLHDYNIWEQFTKVEAERIKAFLKLPDNSGVKGLEQALRLRFYANINRDEILVNGNELIYRTLECRVQMARKRKGMEFHPCKPVGLVEYTEFARVIDSRFACEALSCYPDITDDTCNCSWKFILKE